MPVALRYKGFRFFFYSNEGSPSEPMHVHVRGEGGEAKFWIRPDARVADSDGFDARTLRELAHVVDQNSEMIKRPRMNTSPKCIRFDEDSLWVDLADGRVIAVPLAWFPRLLHATPEQRAKVELSKRGLHWQELDEDVSVAGLPGCWSARAT